MGFDINCKNPERIMQLSRDIALTIDDFRSISEDEIEELRILEDELIQAKTTIIQKKTEIENTMNDVVYSKDQLYTEWIFWDDKDRIIDYYYQLYHSFLSELYTIHNIYEEKERLVVTLGNKIIPYMEKIKDVK